MTKGQPVGVALAAVAALCLLAAAAADCPSKCGFSFTDGPTCGPRSITYTYDLSPVCGTQLTATDSKGHTYSTSICANSDKECLPATWTNTYDYGVSVQFWGATPSCGGASDPVCKDSTGNSTCCTADCQVLGVLPAKKWEVVDPQNPATGGIQVSYTGAAPSDSDPFWCMFNPATGAQYERRVTHIFQCAPKIDTIEVVSAKENTTNDCRYSITFATKYACAELSAMRSVALDTDGNVLPFGLGTQQLGSGTTGTPPARTGGLSWVQPGAIAVGAAVGVVVGAVAAFVVHRVLSSRRRARAQVVGKFELL